MEYYYHPDLSSDCVKLSEEEAKHLKVLHHKAGDTVLLSDGKGCLATSSIMAMERNGAMLAILERKQQEKPRNFALHIAIAPTKNRDRIEWFVEKSVEIGIEYITLITCEHSERIKIDLARLERIAVSAMKQSQTAWLPEINSRSFVEFMQQNHGNGDRFIAWCGAEAIPMQLFNVPLCSNDITVLIGPEGDFSIQEIAMAKRYDFQEVLLGNKRLRTETAGLYACTVISARKEFEK